MLDIANEILKLPITKIDLNFHPDFSQQHEIQSVPILMLMSKGEEQKNLCISICAISFRKFAIIY